MLAINGSLFSVLNWSYGGVFIDPGSHIFNVGAPITIEGIGEKEEGMPTNLVALRIPSRIVRQEADGGVAINCLQIDDDTLALLQQYEENIK